MTDKTPIKAESTNVLSTENQKGSEKTNPTKTENKNAIIIENKKSEKTNTIPTEIQKEDEGSEKTTTQTEETTKSHQVGDQEFPESPRAEEKPSSSNKH